MPVAAHLAAIVVASLSTAPVEAGVPDVRTEGASHVLTFLLKLTCMFFDVPTHEKTVAAKEVLTRETTSMSRV